MDQAETLRKLINVGPARSLTTQAHPRVRVISVTSGKGGVGKTNVVANLAVHLSQLGRKVLVLDGDFGLSNLNILFGVDAKRTLDDVIHNAAAIDDVITPLPCGANLISSSSGILRMTQLNAFERRRIIEALEDSQLDFDTLLIDTGAGVSPDVAYLNSAAQDVLVVTTPEPTALADAYALMKVMSQSYRVKRFKLLVNRTQTPRDGIGVYNHLLRVSDRFLNIQIDYLGHVPEDRKLQTSVLNKAVVSEAFPDALSSESFANIARAVESDGGNSAAANGQVQFFWRRLLQEVRV